MSDGNGHSHVSPEGPAPGPVHGPVLTAAARSDGRLDGLARLPIPPDAAQSLPEEFVRRNSVLPLLIHDRILYVATVTPGNRRVVDEIRLLTGLEVHELIAGEREIADRIAECHQETVEEMSRGFDAASGLDAEGKNLHDIEVMANEPTVVNLVNLIIATAIREGASDIHLLPFENILQLRYRVDGLLREKTPPPKPVHAALVSRVKIMADMNIAERYLPQDGHIQINHRGARVDIRVGTMPTIHGESLVLRLLQKDAKLLSPVELGLDSSRAATLSRLVSKPHGLFLTTGPTGSGKTTTLYSILQGLYSPERKILTIEDPVEYELAGVAQIPVKPGRGFTFATGLRAILRQDPDVIMVGEIRDSETAEIAIRAALTGHQVFSTLHTNDAPSAVTRLMDMGIEPFLISSSLDGVLAQRLVRKVCTFCRQPAEPSEELMAKLGSYQIPGNIVRRTFYRGQGCDECREGYRGRTGIFELLAVTSELREQIVRKSPASEMKATALRTMMTMREDALEKAANGLTTLEEIVRVCSAEGTE